MVTNRQKIVLVTLSMATFFYDALLSFGSKWKDFALNDIRAKYKKCSTAAQQPFGKRKKGGALSKMRAVCATVGRQCRFIISNCYQIFLNDKMFVVSTKMSRSSGSSVFSKRIIDRKSDSERKRVLFENEGNQIYETKGMFFRLAF